MRVLFLPAAVKQSTETAKRSTLEKRKEALLFDTEELMKRFREEKLKRSRPWEPISDTYLTAREFLSLVGIRGKSKAYRRALRHLIQAAYRSDVLHLQPDTFKDCFREGLVRCHSFQGTTGGVVEFEYRVPVESLNEKYAELAKKLIDARHTKNPYAVPLSKKTFMRLSILSEKMGKSNTELVEELVQKELERFGTHES